MRKEEYQKLVSEYTPKENKWKNAVIAFLVGGLVGFLGQVIVAILQNSFGMETTEACSWLCVIIIFLASLATALAGFAHSVTSAALDYRKDGFITGLGSSFFKLAGSVILYGIISGFFLAILGVIIYG